MHGMAQETGARTSASHRSRRLLVGLVAAGVAALSLTSAAQAAQAAPATRDSSPGLSVIDNALPRASSPAVTAPLAGHATTRPRTDPTCTYNGQSDIVYNVLPGSTINIVCSGWSADEMVAAAQISPLALADNDSDAVDENSIQTYTTDGSGNLTGTFVVPNPFTAVDPAAVCPPTPAQMAEGLLRCGVLLADAGNNVSLGALDYANQAPTAVGVAATHDGGGYWIAWSNGDVTMHGDAVNYGNAFGLPLSAPITHIVATPDGRGYWLVAGDGGTFAYGDAGFYGSTGGMTLNAPVVDMAPTSDGRGYWLVASDGGIFSFGDAVFQGSMGGQTLNAPVVGMDGDGGVGYWLVASDGGIFSFGGAPFYGSTGGIRLNLPVNGMAATLNAEGNPGGLGYWFVASDGGIFSYGNAMFHGSTGGMTLAAPVVGMAADSATGGYWLLGADGGIFAFGAPFYGSH